MCAVLSLTLPLQQNKQWAVCKEMKGGFTTGFHELSLLFEKLTVLTSIEM